MIPITGRIGVKKVIKGSVTFSSEANMAITISSVVPEKSIVILNPDIGSSGSDGDESTYYSPLYISRFVSLTSTKLTITSTYYDYDTGTYSSGTVYGSCSYQIIEFY